MPWRPRALHNANGGGHCGSCAGFSQWLALSLMSAAYSVLLVVMLFTLWQGANYRAESKLINLSRDELLYFRVCLTLFSVSSFFFLLCGLALTIYLTVAVILTNSPCSESSISRESPASSYSMLSTAILLLTLCPGANYVGDSSCNISSTCLALIFSISRESSASSYSMRSTIMILRLTLWPDANYLGDSSCPV